MIKERKLRSDTKFCVFLTARHADGQKISEEDTVEMLAAFKEAGIDVSQPIGNYGYHRKLGGYVFYQPSQQPMTQMTQESVESNMAVAAKYNSVN